MEKKEFGSSVIYLVSLGLALFAIPVSAQTAEEIIAKDVKTIGCDQSFILAWFNIDRKIINT